MIISAKNQKDYEKLAAIARALGYGKDTKVDVSYGFENRTVYIEQKIEKGDFYVNEEILVNGVNVTFLDGAQRVSGEHSFLVEMYASFDGHELCLIYNISGKLKSYLTLNGQKMCLQSDTKGFGTFNLEAMPLKARVTVYGTYKNNL